MKKNITILFALISATFAFSQTNNKQNKEASPVDTASKIRVFSPNSSSTSSNRANTSYKWCVKTDVFSAIVGEFPIIGEYRIADKFSVEGSAALTYSYLGELINDEDLNIKRGNSSVGNPSVSEMGTAFRASIKYFPSSDYDALEGWYFGIQLMTKNLKRGYANESSNYTFTGKDVITKTGASLIIGKQVFSESNIIFDYYFGIGLVNKSHQFQSYNNDTQKIEDNELSKQKPNFIFGLRIGFGN